jgi:hypothetical protein
MRTILFSGSSGPTEPGEVRHFDRQGHPLIGVDNKMCRVFFGGQSDASWNLERPEVQRIISAKPPSTYVTAPRSKRSSARFEQMTGDRLYWRYLEEARKGDHP